MKHKIVPFLCAFSAVVTSAFAGATVEANALDNVQSADYGEPPHGFYCGGNVWEKPEIYNLKTGKCEAALELQADPYFRPDDHLPHDPVPASADWDALATFQGALKWGTCDVVRTGNTAVVNEKGEECQLSWYPYEMEGVEVIDFRNGAKTYIPSGERSSYETDYNKNFPRPDIAYSDMFEYDGHHITADGSDSWEEAKKHSKAHPDLDPNRLHCMPPRWTDPDDMLCAPVGHAAMSKVRELKGFNTLNTARMITMPKIYNLTALKTLDLSNMDVTHVPELGHGGSGDWLSDMPELEYINADGLNFKDVVTTDDFAARMPKLKEFSGQGLHLDPAGIPTYGNMFAFDPSLEKLDLSGFDVSRSLLDYYFDAWVGGTTRYTMSKGGMYQRALKGDTKVCDIQLSKTLRLVPHTENRNAPEDIEKDPDSGVNSTYGFTGSIWLDSPWRDEHYNGLLQEVGNGTPEDPRGEIRTTEQLMDARPHPGHWVCHPSDKERAEHKVKLPPPPVEDKPELIIPPEPNVTPGGQVPNPPAPPVNPPAPQAPPVVPPVTPPATPPVVPPVPSVTPPPAPQAPPVAPPVAPPAAPPVVPPAGNLTPGGQIPNAPTVPVTDGPLANTGSDGNVITVLSLLGVVTALIGGALFGRKRKHS